MTTDAVALDEIDGLLHPGGTKDGGRPGLPPQLVLVLVGALAVLAAVLRIRAQAQAALHPEAVLHPEAAPAPEATEPAATVS